MPDDAIGTLGLDVKPFEQALNTVNAEMADLLVESKKLNAEIALLEYQMRRAAGGTQEQSIKLLELKGVAVDFTEQITKLKAEQKALGQTVEQTNEPIQKVALSLRSIVGLIGAGIGVNSLMGLFHQFYKAEDEAQKLDEAILKIGQSEGSSEYRSLSALESRLGQINKEVEELTKQRGPLDSFFETMRQGMVNLVNLDPGGEGRKRESQIDSLLKAQKEAQAEIAEKIKAQNEVLQLKIQHDEYEADLLKNELKYREEIGKAIKDGNTGLVTELETQKKLSEELIKQINLEKQKKTASEIAGEQAKTAIGGLLGDEKNKNDIDDRQADRKQSEMDFFHQQEQKRGDDAIRDDAARKKRLFEEAQRQNKDTARAQIQTGIGDIRQGGNSRTATELEIRQRFTDRRSAAVNNPDLMAELDKQEKQALRDVRAAEASETPRQRIAERDYNRKQDNLASRQDARDAETKRRADRGVDSKAVRDLKDKDEIQKKQAAQVDQAKKDASKEGGKGYNDTDRQYLKQIADALKSQD